MIPAAFVMKFNEDLHRRYLTVAVVLVFMLSLMKLIFCKSMPNNLRNDAEIHSAIQGLMLAIPILSTSLYVLYTKNWLILSAFLGFYGLFIVSTTTNFGTQFYTFYIGRSFELVDDQLAAIDERLGFDWGRYFDWMAAHSTVRDIAAQAYQSIFWQPIVLVAGFLVLRRLRDCCCLQIALPISFVLTCGIATVLPALGAYQFHGMTADRHIGMAVEFTDGMTAPITWLRAADFSRAMPDFGDVRIITFPSWHAAAAIIYMWSFASLTWIGRGFGVALNAAMLAATPVFGSHYLVDLIVGALVGAASVVIAEALLGRTREAVAWRSQGAPAPA